MYFKKTISLLVLIAFIFTNTGYAAPSSRQLLKNKKVDYQKLSTQREETLQKTKSIINGEDVNKQASQKKETQRILSSHLQDISQIHIPSEIGRVIEVYDASNTEKREERTENRLIVHIQDLHTNPEAQYNSAKILEILLKDYNLGLVCSEGADGEVDTSSVSSFPDSEVREKTAKIFVNSGELTGEEYLSITKYPDLPIWGIEDRDIYFKNIIDFNKIMKFNPQSQVFISQAKKTLEELKPKIYSKELLQIDQKETDYEAQRLETADYLKYLLDLDKGVAAELALPKLQDGKASFAATNTARFKNIGILMESLRLEKTIDQQKIMQESQNLLLNLQSAIQAKSLSTDIDTLMANAQLFKDQKISPFSFYSYLKDLALKHNVIEIASAPAALRNDNVTGSVIARSEATKQSKYPNLIAFIDYLTKVNSLDSTKLFIEMEALTYDIKQRLAKKDEEKTLTQSLRNIKFLEGFFNLKISNEELDYYLENKENFKVGWFKKSIDETLKGKFQQRNPAFRLSTYIDFNPDLIDSHLQEIEDFYKTVKQRDIAMFNNSISEIQKRNVKVAALISGGFHTKGLTRLLKDKGYSYIVVSPYSKTEIDEENYHYLLSGKRKPLSELIEEFNNTLRLGLPFVKDAAFAAELKNVLEAAGITETQFIESNKQRILGLYAGVAVRDIYLRARKENRPFQLAELQGYFPKAFYDELYESSLAIEVIENNESIHVVCGDEYIGVSKKDGHLIKSNPAIVAQISESQQRVTLASGKSVIDWEPIPADGEIKIPVKEIESVKIRLGQGDLYIRFHINPSTMVPGLTDHSLGYSVRIILSLDEDGSRPLLDSISPEIQSPIYGELGEEGEVCKIGREAGNNIVVNNPYVSRKHLQIELREGNVIIKDLKPANKGTVAK
ncbi:MAG: hypothetical protein COX40_02765, partial [Candidatus Omnitrophica bacterium CG23_combo_of_CG06-09_8_20_14_all_40_11]